MKLYITHYTPLTERKEFLLEQFKRFEITEYEFITDFDREVLTDEHNSKFDDILQTERSLFLKHIQALEKFVESNEDVAAMVEDDFIFESEYHNRLERVLYELKDKDNFIIFCSDCCDIHTYEKIIPEKITYKSNGSRGTAFYLLTKKAAKIILNKFYNSKINKAIDHWFNSLVNDILFLFSEPYLGTQGSISGFFPESVAKRYK